MTATPAAHACTSEEFAARLKEYNDGLVVRPGDTLIVRIGTNVTRDTAEQLRAAVLQRLPGLADVVLIGADGLAVYRPDEVVA